MGIQQAANGRRNKVVVAFAASVALALAGCGGGGNKELEGKSSPTKSSLSNGGGSNQDAVSPEPDPTEILAQIKGEKDMVVTIAEATRDPGGFVTVEGTITNNGDSSFDATAWRGQELAVVKSGASVAGAILVDQAGKKRYYVLRDTDGECLCTTKLISIKPKETRPFFAQFPAPPESTTEVEFQLPTMPPAKIQISEG